MTRKAEKSKGAAYLKRRNKIINALWGESYSSIKVWRRDQNVGYTTIPRVLPYITEIMDKLSDSGKPLSSCYWALWCRVFDEGYLEIKEEKSLALESGFSGQRATYTWKSRMKKLQEMGFISVKPGSLSDYQHIIIVNPIEVVKELYKERNKDAIYNSFSTRLIEVGVSLNEE